jgi:Sulfotransferase domain
VTTKREPAPSGALPNLIIIGAQKCGTTSLHNYLDAHPESAMSRRKETDFFLPNGNWDRGLDWYASQFDPAAKVRGETSTGYTNLPASTGTAERIRSVVPGARLIYLVREPLDRMVSHYLHWRALGLERRPLREALSDPGSFYVTRSCYATQLKPFLDLFPREQIMVQTHERLLKERQETLRRIFDFVGIDSSFTSAEFDRMWERSEGKSRLYSLTWQLAQRTRGRGVFLPRFLRWPAQRLVRMPVRHRRTDRPVIEGELRERLRERLRDEVHEFRTLTGVELEGWNARSLGV